jgi:hypothetical protein
MTNFRYEDGNQVCTDVDMLPEKPNAYPLGHKRVVKWVAEGNTIQPYVGPGPLELWDNAMGKTDHGMPRSLEDVLDMTGTNGLAQTTLDKYNSKKALRATKP